MCEFIDNVRGSIDPFFCVILSKGREVVGYHQHLSNHPWLDGTMSQIIQQVQPPYDEHVVREYEIFLWEYSEVLGLIFLPRSYVPSHQFRVCR